MSEQKSRTASDDVYDRELEEPRSGRRRRPVADWGVGEDMFEHVPRSRRFSRVAEGPPRDRRFTSRAADADRRSAGEPVARVDDEPRAPEAEESAHVADWSARDDSARARRREEPRRYTGPLRDGAGEEEEPPRRRPADATPPEGYPRGGAADGRRTITIGKPEDVPSEIAAITADRDLGDESEELPPEAAAERRTVRIGGRPEGSLEAARSYRDRSRRRPPKRAHERLGARPDRIAMWAFALGLLLIIIAILTAH